SALGLMDLSNGKVTRLERVRTYQVNETGTAVGAYHREAGRAQADPSKKTPAGGKGKKGKAAAQPQAVPSDLIVRNLTTGKERTLTNVTEYSLAKDGQSLVYVVVNTKESDNGVFSINPGTEAVPVALRTGPGRFTRMVWDDKQAQLAF